MSNLFFYCKVQLFWLVMESHFIHLATTAGPTVPYSFGQIFVNFFRDTTGSHTTMCDFLAIIFLATRVETANACIVFCFIVKHLRFGL